MERYICIHAHLYQPPRENPWLETVEQQDSAYPFHDWNERITAECYGPNGASRIVDEAGRIEEIVNNYSRISFNFGPTLLSWLEDKAPDVYGAILAADRESAERYSGHGSAVAQVYNHIIMPLANRRDKETQVRWGIEDFRHRFNREPEGMWLAETAVDIETLEVLAENNIRFTILSPYQAARIRRNGTRNWKEVSNGGVDPTCAYQCKLPSGKSIALFFYDGPISRAVAFEKLLNSGEQFAQRLISGFNDQRDWPQLMHIATDGESYGHHHPHGDMALAYALKHIEENGLARLTNYGEYLEKFPPQFEAQIIERTAWSCSHGVERWNSDCGCNSGAQWNQQWRGPLRSALDFLRDAVAPLYEQRAATLLRDPWKARDGYIRVMLDRSSDNLKSFLAEHATGEFDNRARVDALKLLEMQRHALLMYTSCGWFFDEISGIETVQIIFYAGRVLQLARELFGESAAHIESGFLDRLQHAKSNLPEFGDGAEIYCRIVVPSHVTLADVAAHYAISSLFEPTAEEVPIYCFDVERYKFRSTEFGRSRMAVGRARICSKITQESAEFTFGVLHFGDHNLSAGVRVFVDEKAYTQLERDTSAAFARADLAQVIRVLDHHFGQVAYSLRSLFGDERKKILDHILRNTLREAEATYRQIYDSHAPLLRFLASSGLKRPEMLAMTAEFVINAALRRELGREDLDPQRIRALLQQAKDEGLRLDTVGLGFHFERTLNRLTEQFAATPENLEGLQRVSQAVGLARSLQLPLNLWRAQNIFYRIAQEVLPGMRGLGNERSRQWVELFVHIGEQLYINMENLNAVAELPLAV